MESVIIEDGATLYAVEIKMTASPMKSMARAFEVLNEEKDHSVGTGVILCQYEKKLWLSDHLVALPSSYI